MVLRSELMPEQADVKTTATNHITNITNVLKGKKGEKSNGKEDSRK